MKFAIPEISWHNRDPVLSVDFQPKSEGNEPLRIATGGTDSHVLIWYITTTETGAVNLEVAADLTRHQKAVNVVRWSPNGQLLASGDDESIIFIWKQKNEEPAPVAEGEEHYKETWVIHKTLRGHMEDVLDVSWSLDSRRLASGSVDNKLLLWDVPRGKYSAILADHKGFVQGVAWDPREQLVATLSTDRVLRTFDISTKKVYSRSSKATLPLPDAHPLHGLRVRLYHDDTLQTYYRRLQWSPDGLLLAAPAGRMEPEQRADVRPLNAVYIYTRYCLKTPACVLPCGEPALVVRWSPRQYTLRAEGPSPAFPAASRMLLAVGTKRSVLLYDTQQKTPLAVISNIHYTRLTDLTWSPDGRTLVASSTDGFCSVVMFSEHELGQVMPELVAAPGSHTEPMDVQTEENQTEKDKQEESKQTTNKIDSFIKFKAPSEKLSSSPKKRKMTKPQKKTPVKLDLLVETAMPSWSDNSNSEMSKAMIPDQPDDVMVVEDSEDMKLVYEDTVNNSESENSDKSPDVKNKSPNDKSEKMDVVSSEKGLESPVRTRTSPKQVDTPKGDGDFMKQAKVTDVKDAVKVPSAPSPKAPRRVNFVTLSSPKNKKKC